MDSKSIFNYSSLSSDLWYSKAALSGSAVDQLNFLYAEVEKDPYIGQAEVH